MSAESRSRELPLAGERVAFVGRLASVSRDEAKRLVEAAGGRICGRRRSAATLIVIGQGSWPVSRSGGLPRRLALAESLRRSGSFARVLREADWLDVLDLSERGESIRRRYSLPEIAERTGIPASRIRRWVRAGLVAPVETLRGGERFEFWQIAAVRRLDELVRSGVDPRRLKRTMSRLRRWLPEAERALARLDLLDQRLTLRDDQGELIDIDGQRLFDFAGEEEAHPTELSLLAFDESRPSIEAEFERACSLEREGSYVAAEGAYRDWLVKYGPDPDVCFNLANVLRELGRNEAAIERYRQAIELDPEYAAAWLNLGIALADEGRCEESVEAARRAVAIDPEDGSALYSLADALDDTNCAAEAADCWRAYLRVDEDSEYAAHARSRLETIES